MPVKKRTTDDSPTAKLTKPNGNKEAEPANEISVPQNIFVPVEKIVAPSIEQPLVHIKDIVGESAANIQLQEVTQISQEGAVSNTRTLNLEMPAKKRLPEVSYPMLALILGTVAIVGLVLVFLFGGA